MKVLNIYSNYLKRPLDIVLATSGLILFTPFLAIVALLIFVNDGSPVLFVQQRIGKNRKKFNIYKLRSMSNSSTAINGQFDIGSSTRVTPIGKIIRRLKLDELPQLANVLVGDMSFVGPRPEVEKWTLKYKARWDNVLRVRPGISDWASIEFKNEEYILGDSDNPEDTYQFVILPKKLDMCEKYIEDISFAGDIKILWSTVFGKKQEKNNI